MFLCRFLEMPTGRLLQRWPGAVLSDSDRVWCMYAFVTLVYGLLLPLLLLYVKEVHFRGKRAVLFCGCRCSPHSLHVQSWQLWAFVLGTGPCLQSRLS